MKILIQARVVYVSWYGYAHAYKKELISVDAANYDISDDMAKLLNLKLGGK